MCSRDVTQHNLSELPDIFALAKTVNAKRVIVFNFIPTGRAQEHLDMDLTPFQREQMLEKVYDELLKGDIEALCTAPQLARVCLAKTEETNVDIFAPTHFYAADLGGKIKGLSDFIGGCGAGRIYCAVQPNGAVTPCVFMPIVVGDLTKQTLNEIWRSSPVLRALRDREKLKGECGKCQYKYICGGCRARAYAYTHDVLAPEQGCIKIPEMQNIEVAHAC